jgi:hypothetical protein
MSDLEHFCDGFNIPFSKVIRENVFKLETSLDAKHCAKTRTPFLRSDGVRFTSPEGFFNNHNVSVPLRRLSEDPQIFRWPLDLPLK